MMKDDHAEFEGKLAEIKQCQLSTIEIIPKSITIEKIEAYRGLTEYAVEMITAIDALSTKVEEFKKDPKNNKLKSQVKALQNSIKPDKLRLLKNRVSLFLASSQKVFRAYQNYHNVCLIDSLVVESNELLKDESKSGQVDRLAKRITDLEKLVEGKPNEVLTAFAALAVAMREDLVGESDIKSLDFLGILL